jgi:hypothetical protein
MLLAVCHPMLCELVPCTCFVKFATRFRLLFSSVEASTY